MYFYTMLHAHYIDALERLILFFTISFVLIVIDTLMKLFSLTIIKYPLWHYKTIISVFWGGWGEEKTSRVFYRGFVFKLFEYSLLCVFAFTLDIIKIPAGIGYLDDVLKTLSLFCYLLIIVTEFWSFKENYKLIKYNNHIVRNIDTKVLSRLDTISLGDIKIKLREKDDRKHN